MNGVRIAPAVAADADAIRALVAAANLPLDGLDDHLRTTLVARRGDVIIGIAALEMYADGALLRSVAVIADERGTGVGLRLTEAALALAAAHGRRDVYLLTTTAERFFPRFGFDAIGRDDVPASVRASVEFRGACPASAIVMRRSQPV
jgi:amino-acid N-acetyltransferase